MNEEEKKQLRKMKKGAILSDGRRLYRYSLWREWDNDKGTCVFVGLNPSTANETEDDPTIRRCINFAKSWGFGKLVMLNLFAYRATNPDDMKIKAGDSVGPENNYYLLKECKKADIVVAAWGNHGSFYDRDREVKELLSKSNIKMKCFKITKAGQPIHPLYQKSDAELIDY